MINLHVYDPDNHLFLTGFYLPKQHVFRRGRDAGNGSSREWARVPDEEGMARILTALAGQLAGVWLRESTIEPMPIGLETWALGYSAKGAFESWFVDEPPGTRYRVWMHRTPRRHGQCSLPVLWDEVYNEFDAKGTPPLRRRSLPGSALHSGVVVLEEALAAYRAGPAAAAEVIQNLGHPLRHVTDRAE